MGLGLRWQRADLVGNLVARAVRRAALRSAAVEARIEVWLTPAGGPTPRGAGGAATALRLAHALRPDPRLAAAAAALAEAAAAGRWQAARAAEIDEALGLAVEAITAATAAEIDRTARRLAEQRRTAP